MSALVINCSKQIVFALMKCTNTINKLTAVPLHFHYLYMWRGKTGEITCLPVWFSCKRTAVGGVRSSSQIPNLAQIFQTLEQWLNMELSDSQFLKQWWPHLINTEEHRWEFWSLRASMGQYWTTDSTYIRGTVFVLPNKREIIREHLISKWFRNTMFCFVKKI